MEAYSLNAVYKVNSDIAWREINDEIVFYNPFDDRLCVFRSTAKFLWKRINGEASVGDLASQMIQEYEVKFEAAAEDTLNFLRGLCEARVLIKGGEKQ